MSIDHPWILLAAILCAVALVAGLLRAERRRTERDLVYSNIQFFERAVAPRRWIERAWRAGWIAALVCVALAFGGLHARLPLPVRDGSVFMCIDTSGSMRSTDVPPTRADAAKAAAAAFIDEAPAGTRIGVIAFASGAEIVAPLSRNHALVKSALDHIPAPNGATAIGDALQLAAQNLPPTGHRVVVLITDGVNNTGADPQALAAYLGAHHVPVYTVGIGTPNGDIIGGQQTTIDEGALQSYAQVSGGAYARAENATQLRNALARLGRQTLLEPQDIALSFPLALVAALAFAGTLVFGLTTGRLS